MVHYPYPGWLKLTWIRDAFLRRIGEKIAEGKNDGSVSKFSHNLYFSTWQRTV
jgi:hypothetical protein